MGAPAKAGGGAKKRASSAARRQVSVGSIAETATEPTLTAESSRARLPKPPQGHGGYERKLTRVPPRRDGTPPRYTNESVKPELLETALALASQRGYEALRISDVTDPVGVTRQAFYAHFRDKRHCLCEAIDPKLGAILELTASADEHAPRWAEHVIAAIDEALAERFHSSEGTRGRLLAAMTEMLRETESLDAVRIGKLVRRAHVPTADFYRQFSGKQECFAVTYEELLDGVFEDALPTGTRQPTRPSSEALGALGQALAADPVRMQLLVVEASKLPQEPREEMAGSWRGSLRERIAELLASRADNEAEAGRAALAASSAVEVIRSTAVAGDAESLPGRLSDLAQVIGGELRPAASPRHIAA